VGQGDPDGRHQSRMKRRCVSERDAMKLPRRKFLHLAAGAAALPAVSRRARAQTYPARPVRLVVGFPAGGTNDIHARLIAEWRSQQFGRSFIVENRPGAAGNIGLESVVRAAPDGYTLSVCGSTELRNEILYTDLKFSFLRDTAPVASMILAMNVLVVHPAFSARSVPELIAATKANPDALTVTSAAVGSTSHVVWQLFGSGWGGAVVPGRWGAGAPALGALLGEGVGSLCPAPADTMEYIKTGKLLALAVTGATRTQALPDVPTIGEFVPGYEAVGWLGVVAPKDTPVGIIDLLNKAINAGLADPKIRQTIADWGETVL